MKTSIKLLTLAWIGLSSFVFSPDKKPISTKEIPTHNSPMISVSIAEKQDQTLQVQVLVEKVFLKSKGLTNKQFKPLLVPLKNYFKDHLKVNINDNKQLLHLKSISENKLRMNLTYQIKNIKSVENMHVFSDCLTEMEHHDRIPIHIKIGTINKKYRISKEKTSIEIKF